MYVTSREKRFGLIGLFTACNFAELIPFPIAKECMADSDYFTKEPFSDFKNYLRFAEQSDPR